jgi:hypothetical protein
MVPGKMIKLQQIRGRIKSTASPRPSEMQDISPAEIVARSQLVIADEIDIYDPTLRKLFGWNFYVDLYL